MSDDVTLNPGVGGSVIATDEIAGKHYQRVKPVHGVDGVAIDVSATNPLPTVESGAALTALQNIENVVLAEDGAHSSGDAGIQALAVRNDSDTSLAGTSLDYTPLQVDSSGFLKVNIKAGAAAGGTSSTDDAPFTAAVGSGTPMMGFATSDSVDSGDVGVVGMTTARAIKATLYDSGGTEIAIGGGTQYTEDAAAAANPIGNAIIMVRDDSLAGSLTSANGDNVALRGNNKGEVYVKHTDSVLVTNAGTFAVQATVAAGATNIAKAEDVASADADVGVPAMMVRKATPANTSGTDGDYEFIQGSAGRVWVSATVDAALPAGANAIGKLAANSGVDIGDVDITSIIPGTAANNLGKAEDAAATTGDTGIAVLAVRRDVASSGVSADGDYANLSVDSTGALRVAGSAGTTQYTEDSPSTGAESLVLCGAVRRDTAASSSGTDGDYSTLNTDSTGNLRVNVSGGGIAAVVEDAPAAGGEDGVMILGVRRDTAASSSGADGDFSTFNLDANGRLHVISALAASQTLATVTNVATIGTSVTPGTAAANLGKAEDAAHASGDTGVMMLSVRKNTAVATSDTDSDYQPLITDTNGRLHVLDANSASALTSLQLIDDPVLTDDTAFTPATSKVMMAGFEADETATDSVDEGDAGAGRMTLDRKIIVTPYAHAAAGGTSNYTALSTAAVLTAQIKGSAGKVFSIECYNINAAARYVRLYDQTGAPASTDTANVVWQGIIPGATTGAGFTVTWPMGKQFATGIGIRATTGIAHNSTGALAADELTFNVSYA